MSFLDSYFLMALVILALHTVNDVRKGKVDSRKNWFMSGVNLAFIVFAGYNTLSYVGVLLATVLFMAFVKGMGEGDKDIFLWLIPGLFLVDVWPIAVFLGLYFTFYLLSYFIKEAFNLQKMATPGVPMILAAFLGTVFMYYLTTDYYGLLSALSFL